MQIALFIAKSVWLLAGKKYPCAFSKECIKIGILLLR